MTPDISAIAQKHAKEYTGRDIAGSLLEQRIRLAIEEATASLRAQLENQRATYEEICAGIVEEKIRAEGERDVALAALKALFGATLNEMAARNLPEEWTADSPMADAAKLLGVAQESPLNGKEGK